MYMVEFPQRVAHLTPMRRARWKQVASRQPVATPGLELFSERSHEQAIVEVFIDAVRCAEGGVNALDDAGVDAVDIDLCGVPWLAASMRHRLRRTMAQRPMSSGELPSC